MTANGAVSWIEYIASLAVRLPHRDRRGQACPEHQAGADLELLPDRLASRASHGVHHAAEGRLTGEPACLMTMPRHLATPGHRPRPAVLNPPGLRATGSLVSRPARPVLRLWRGSAP